MNICVAGTGYVGLVTGAVFADLGNDVICVDKDDEKITALSAGRMPIYEPGLEEMVARNAADRRLAFTTDLGAAVPRSEIVFIAVGTPSKRDGETDLGAVEAVAKGIGQAMERYTVIVNKSTVPVGTGEFVRDVITRHQSKRVPFDVVSNPEFLREGSAIEDTLRPDRIVIGAPNQLVAMTLLELYAPLERPMIITDVPSAEMIKYASNAFLASKISFINAIANVCDLAGADVTQVMKGVGLDSRIGPAFLQAGLGFGGSCFPKDAESLVHTAARLGYDFRLLRAVVEVNRNARCTSSGTSPRSSPARRQGRGRARPRLQAEHRRHARGAERRGDRAAARGGRHRARVRPGRDRQRARRAADGGAVRRLRLRGRPRRGRGRPRHRVERVQVPQPRAPPVGDAPPPRLRRPQRLGAGADAAPRVRVPFDRPQTRPPA